MPKKNTVSNWHFGSNTLPSKQVHQIAEIIREIQGKNCTAAHKPLIKCDFKDCCSKLEKILPHANYRTLQSYLKERLFLVKIKDETTNFSKIEAGVPQESVLWPVLYVIYKNDLPTSDSTTTATFVDVTSILVMHEYPAITSMKLQTTINKIEAWVKKLRIKINQSRSTHITFTLYNETLSDSANGQCCSAHRPKIKTNNTRMTITTTWTLNEYTSYATGHCSSMNLYLMNTNIYCRNGRLLYYI